MTSTAFSQTLQFITSIKLQELEKQRVAYQAHAKVLEESTAAGDDLISRVEILLKAVHSWSGSGMVDPSSTLGGKLNLQNLDLWMPQAREDPSFSPDILRSWIDTLETHVRHSMMRFDCAKLFGNLFNEWLATGDPSTTGDVDQADEVVAAASKGDDGRKERQEQKDRLASIIFDEKVIDKEALSLYLFILFSGEEAVKELEYLRRDLDRFGKHLRKRAITKHDVNTAIHGLLADGLMDEGKRATMAEFLDNDTISDEVASVLNMRMASLDTWSWPVQGIVIYFRRHLNGKYRAYTDPDILDAVLLHYIGIAWQVKLKECFQCIFNSKAWQRSHPVILTAKNERITEQLGRSMSGIETRRQEQRESGFLSQLASTADRPSTYDELADVPTDEKILTGAAVKQKLLHIMTAECHLNTALHGTHAVVRSDLEWFGPSLPHDSILTILAFFGVSEQWLAFFKTFLQTPLRFEEDQPGQVRVRRRGTPIGYALSVVCGEALLFGMDFAVNQRAGGLFLYRIHDDLWLWDAQAQKCVAGWQEMNVYANYVGLKFNESKTGSAYVGASELPAGLPAGDIRWGFLKFDQDVARFIIDQTEVDFHIAEMRRELGATKSVFGWVNVYNKYITFFQRNFGGRPATCFGEAHNVDVIKTLTRIQHDLFPGIEGGPIGHLRSVIEQRFGMRDLPQGYFYLPIGSGGLELRNPMIETFAIRTHSATPEAGFEAEMKRDQETYKKLKEAWEARPSRLKKARNLENETFMTFDEYISLRETWLHDWRQCYDRMLSVRSPTDVTETPAVQTFLGGSDGRNWMSMDWYEQWIVSLYGEEVVKRFGGLEVVDPTLIPVGMVQFFRNSKVALRSTSDSILYK